MKSLENVKAGDKLIVRTEYNEYVAEVERITATLVITKHHRFRRETGQALGNDVWRSVWAMPATAAEIDRVDRLSKRRRLVEKCMRIDFRQLADSQLEEILKITNAQ